MFTDYLGTTVVVDTDGPLCYIGHLDAMDAQVLTLGDVAIYDRQAAHAEYELYLVEAAKYGHAVARREVKVPLGRVLSLSRLSDVVQV